MTKKKTGTFIVIDGTDGSGKTTQLKLLVKALEQKKVKVMTADFPQYGQKSAGPVEEYLGGKYGKLDPYIASLFYAVDRFDASFTIRKWLNEGKVVVSNRYVTASAGHQGGNILNPQARKKYFRWLNDLEYRICNIPKPDLNIILHAPAHVAQELVDKKDSSMRKYVGGKKRDLLEADLEHLRRAEKVYLEIAKTFPKTKLVECAPKGSMLSPEHIAEEVLGLVLSAINRK